MNCNAELIYQYRAECASAAAHGRPLPLWQEPPRESHAAPLATPERVIPHQGIKASAQTVRKIPIEALRFGGGSVTFHKRGTTA